jgi:hypothetical protein
MKLRRNSAPRAGALECAKRKLQVSEWLRDGLTRADIIKQGKEQWGLKPAGIDDYIWAIYREWKDYYNSQKDYLATEALEKRRKLYLRALAKKDLQTARQILNDIDKLTGIWVEKHEVKNDVTFSDWAKYHLTNNSDGKNTPISN